MDNVIILDAISNSTNELNSNIGQLDQKVTNTNTQLSNISNTVNIINNTTKQILYIEQSNTNLLMTINSATKTIVFFEVIVPGNYTIKTDDSFSALTGAFVSRVFTITKTANTSYPSLTFPMVSIPNKKSSETTVYLIPSLYCIAGGEGGINVGTHTNLGRQIKIYGNITYKNEIDLPVLISNNSI